MNWPRRWVIRYSTGAARQVPPPGRQPACSGCRDAWRSCSRSNCCCLLPGGGPRDLAHLHRRHLVLGAVGGPVGVVGGDHVGPAEGEMEGGVDHAGLHALGQLRAQHVSPARLAIATSRRRRCRVPRHRADGFPAHPRWCQTLLAVRRVCAPTLYCERMRPVVSSSGKRAGDLLVGGNVFGDDEQPLAAHELVHVHDRRALGRRVVAGPLDAAQPDPASRSSRRQRSASGARSRP